MRDSIKTFDKLIDAKEREKQSMLTHYNNLLAKFEEASEKLIALLKKEEKAKLNLKELTNRGTIAEIQQQTQFIQFLQPSITRQEAIFKQAKDELHIEKLKLVKKDIEKKKFEIVKEKKIETIRLIEKEKESKEMDEISINQFMKRVMA